MLGIDEHRYRSVRFFRDPATKAWKRYEPWMTTIVDLDTGQVLGTVDGRDSEGVGDWLFARPLQWRLGVQVVAIDPSAAFRKALRMWLPRTAVSVDAFHLVKLGNDMLTEVRQRLTQQVHGRRGRSIDPVWANRRLLLRAGDTLSNRARNRLNTVFDTDDATGKLQAAWLVKEQFRALLTTGSLADAAAAKDRLQVLVVQAAQPETNRLWRTVCRWWKEIEVLIVTGATTAKLPELVAAERHFRSTLVSRGIHVGTPAMLAASECASAGIALSTLEERGARAGRHEYEMLIYPETVKIARLITRPSFKDWIQNPAHPAGQRRDRVASEIARTIFRTGEGHRRRAAQRIENALRRLSRRGIEWLV